MMRIFATSMIAAFGFFLILPIATGAFAEDAKGQSMKLPPGAKAEIHGTTAIIHNGGGGNGIAGTFDCKCTGEGGGQCMITSSSSGLICSNGPPGAKECKGACILITSTTGVMGVGPAAAKGPSSGSPASAGAAAAKPKQ
jgi:hypothetical protein